MIPSQFLRRIPFLRRPFFQRDQAVAERGAVAAERDRVLAERDALLAAQGTVNSGHTRPSLSLWAEFLGNQHRPIHKWKHYFPVYENHFDRYINRPLTVLEIGCGKGGSLQMWKRYFGPHAQIVGLDIAPECRDFEEDQIAVRIGDQSDTLFLEAVLEEFGTPNIVLDDGSHMMAHILASFSYLYPRTAIDGVYMVEDLHTAYWDEYDGGLRRQDTFVEHCKNLIDELNADWSRDALPPTTFTRSTQSIHFYDSVAVFERGRTLPKNAPMIPPE